MKQVQKKRKSKCGLWIGILALSFLILINKIHLDLYAKRYFENYFESLLFGTSKWRNAETAMCYLNYLSANEPSLGEIWYMIPHNIVTESVIANDKTGRIYEFTFLAKMANDIYKMVPTEFFKVQEKEDIEQLKYALLKVFKINTKNLKFYNTKEEIKKTIELINKITKNNSKLKVTWLKAKKQKEFYVILEKNNVEILNAAFDAQSRLKKRKELSSPQYQEYCREGVNRLNRILEKNFQKNIAP